MRALINNKTKETIELKPGQDYERILAILPDPENWKYVCEERTLVEMELQDSDTGLAERQKRAELAERERKRLFKDQQVSKKAPKTPGLGPK